MTHSPFVHTAYFAGSFDVLHTLPLTSFCVQEKQSAVLKLLAANGAPAPTSSGNVVVVAGEMRSAFLFMQHATLSAKTSQIKVAAVGLVG